MRLRLLSVLAVFTPTVAFAQAAVAPPHAGTDWHSVLGLIIQGALALLFTTVIPTLLVPLLPKIPALTQHFLDWAQHQAGGVKNAAAAGVLNRFIALAGQKVLALENTEVSYLKEQLESGKITKDQLPTLMAGVKQRALDAVKADATAQGLWKDGLSVFLGSDNSLTNWLGDVIESHVAQLPTSNLAAPKVAPSTPVASTTSALKSAAALPPVPVGPATPQPAAAP